MECRLRSANFYALGALLYAADRGLTRWSTGPAFGRPVTSNVNLIRNMLLDLSITKDWLNTANNAIEHIIPHEAIGQVKRLRYDELCSDSLEYLLEAYDNSSTETSFEELQLYFDIYFCSKYKYIKGFHACKITNEHSYRNNGIRCMCKDLLVELAIERFGKHISTGKIMSACEKTEIDDYDNSVFLFPSIERAKEPSQNHYLKCGSEILQGLAWDLGLGNQKILSNQGRSCIIECDIPLKMIQHIFRHDFWRQLITFAFQESMGKSFEQKAPDWGFATNCDISPDNIKFFHYVNDSDYIYTLLTH